MKVQTAVVSLLMLGVLGCNPTPPPKATPVPTASAGSMSGALPPTTAETPKDAPKGYMPDEKADSSTATATPEPSTAAVLKPVALADGAATLSPENTRVQFTGTHTGEKPDPRVGGFEKFSGKLTTEGSMLKDVSLQIDTESLWTEIGAKLTTHLKSPDFFNTKEFPEIKFQSTKVEVQDDGRASITGDLTLHGVTKSVAVPATVKIGEDGVTLKADFTIDRTEFGMDYSVDKVEKSVSLVVVVGEKNRP